MNMSKTLALIHTSATLVPLFEDLVKEYLSHIDLKVFTIVDDSLIKNTIAKNKLTANTQKRLINYIISAEEAGADYIMVTCSSVGPAVEMAEKLVSVPVLRVDLPMADQAVNSGSKIGVLATLPTTLAPTTDLVKRRAIALDKQIEINAKLCTGAFEALRRGEPQTHDEIVAKALLELAQSVDVIVLAQASMARVVNQLDEQLKTVPILGSPVIAMNYLANIL